MDEQRAAFQIRPDAFARLSGLLRLAIAGMIVLPTVVVSGWEAVGRVWVVAGTLAGLGVVALLVQPLLARTDPARPHYADRDGGRRSSRRRRTLWTTLVVSLVAADAVAVLLAVMWSPQPALAFGAFFLVMLELAVVSSPWWTVAFSVAVTIGGVGLVVIAAGDGSSEAWDLVTAEAARVGALGLVLVLFSLAFSHLLAGELRSREEDSARIGELERHVTAMSVTFDAIARGDLRARDVRPSQTVYVLDEGMASLMADLADSSESMRRELATLLTDVRHTGEQIASAADRLRKTAQTEAEASQVQAAAVTQTNSTTRELAATAATVALNTASVAQFADETSAMAVHGRDAVAHSMDGLDRIAARVDAIATRTGRMGEVSEEIGAILDMIEELADETALLSLNAAIEAARAGEHGRGFAVVAEEIRKLADRSMAATRDIQELISEVRVEAQASIEASDAGIEEVAAGAGIVHEVGDALERITDMAMQTSNAAREISTATSQQRAASDQVADAMSAVAATTTSYAETAHDSAQSAAGLSRLAAQLQETLTRFRVEDD
ncbi:MAG: methyl-accepting chemotaxis protein [Acidimicrobiia bacterium]|nr:methyl-accepting chemotaxis protein [Acidimicrobiia bacterium]